MKKLSVRDCEVRGKLVITRVDFNVPLDSDKNITDDTKIVSALPTVKNILDRGGRLILMSHLGRPRGMVDEGLSLLPVAYRLGELLDNPLKFTKDCIGEDTKRKVDSLRDGEMVLLENLRFHPGEEENDPDFSRELASLGEIYVNDAFGTAHRAHASTVGVTEYFNIRAAGILMEKELSALEGTLMGPKRPFVAVLGGAKIKGKINLIKNLLEKVDVLLVGGGMMFTFFKASGLEIGKSIVDDSYLDMCKGLLETNREASKKLLLPVDAIVTEKLEDGLPNREVSSADIPETWLGADIGPKTVSLFKDEINKAKTIF